MATPGDALRAQAEARLQQLRRKVAAHRKVKDDEEADKAQAEIVALTSVLKYIDETSEQMIKVRVICSELELAVPMKSPFDFLCETSFLDLIERYLSVLLRKQEEGCDSDDLQEIVRKLRALRDELDELDADNSSVKLTVALDDDDTGRQTTDFEAEEILAPPPLKDLVDAAMNSRPLPSLPQVVTLRVAGFMPTEGIESVEKILAATGEAVVNLRLSLPEERINVAAGANIRGLFHPLPEIVKGLTKSAKNSTGSLDKIQRVLNMEAAGVEVCVLLDGGATRILVPDFEKTPLVAPIIDHYFLDAGDAEKLEAWPPSEVTVRVTSPLYAAISAPRSLLVVVERKQVLSTKVLSIDDARGTPLVDIALDAIMIGRPPFGGARETLLGHIRRTALVGVTYPPGADQSPDGMDIRLDTLDACRAGSYEIPELESIHAVDAPLGDAINAAAPFVVLYFSGCGSLGGRLDSRVKLSVRDTTSGPTVVVDDMVRSDYFPCRLYKLLGAIMNLMKNHAPITVAPRTGEKAHELFVRWASDPAVVILVTVNGAPREMSWLQLTEARVEAPNGGSVTRVTMEFVLPTLPAPGSRTPEEKLLLEAELPRLVDECVATIMAGEVPSDKLLKKVQVLGNLEAQAQERRERVLDAPRETADGQWLRFLVALRALRKARKAKDRDAERWDLISSLLQMLLPLLYHYSRACRSFLDEYYPVPDASAQVDALHMLALKRLSLETASGRGLDYATELAARVVRRVPDIGHFPESHHPHVLAARLVFAYWIVSGPADKEKAGHRNLRFRGKTLQYPEDEILSSDARQALVECVLRADGYDYADYDAADVDHARHTLADAAALWTEKFDSGAKRRYAVAAAAGHGLAGEIVKRLDSTDLAKLSRQYKLDAFAARHLETLPSGLARLEAVLNFAPSNNGARRAALATSSSADAASVGASFALVDPAARTEPSKRELAARERKARDKEKEEKRRAKRKKAEARRREQAEREAAAREEAARAEAEREEAERPAREAAARAARDAAEAAEAAEAAAREEAKREAAKREEAAREAALARAADEAAEAESEAPVEETAPDDGDWTGVRSRRERRADADAPVDPVIAAAAAAEEYYKGRAAQKLEPEDAAAPPPLAPRARRPSAYDPPPSEEESRRRADEFIASTGVAGAAADKLRSLAPDHQARLVRRLEISAAAGADVEVLIMAADDQQCAATASELAALDPSLRPVADRLALTSAAVSRLASLDPPEQGDLAYRFAEPGLLDDMRDLDQFVARAFEKEKPVESLLRAKESFMEPDLVNAIQGLAVDLSRSCVKELRALDEPTQRHAALALADIDFRGIRDPSAYVIRGLETGSLLARVPAPAMALPATPAPAPPPLNANDPVLEPKSPITPPERTAPPAPAWGAAPVGPPTPAPMWGAIVPPSPTSPAPAWGAIEPPSAPPTPVWGATGPPPPPPAQSWPAPAPTSAWAPPDAFSPTTAWPAVTIETAPPPAWSAGDAMARLGGGADSDDDFVVPEGLVDVERRSNCSLDAIVAVLSQCPTFRRALGNGAEAEAAQSDALRYLGDAFRASAEGSDAGVDAAVDGLRAALAARGNEDEDGEGVRSELATGGAHLDVAEVLGEVMSVLSTSERCQKAASALRTKGHIHQRACVKCGKRNEDFREDVAFDELARSAPATALVDAARSGTGRVADTFREAHAHAAKSCDACHAPAACEVDVILDHAAKALVLSLAWYSTDQDGNDVAALLELVWRDAPMPVEKVFSKNPNGRQRGSKAGLRRLDLFAVAVFQNAHYTAFVRAKDGSDSWTYHDRRSSVAVGSFANVVQRCRDGPMLPYLLFYDALPAPPPGN